MAEPKTLSEALELYKAGKNFGRSDMFTVIVGKMNEFEKRLGSVDEAAVHALTARVAGMELTIGNALTAAAKHSVESNADITEMMRRLSDIHLKEEAEMLGQIKRRPGRPKQETA
jgi:hypothetical protein